MNSILLIKSSSLKIKLNKIGKEVLFKSIYLINSHLFKILINQETTFLVLVEPNSISSLHLKACLVHLISITPRIKMNSVLYIKASN